MLKYRGEFDAGTCLAMRMRNELACDQATEATLSYADGDSTGGGRWFVVRVPLDKAGTYAYNRFRADNFLAALMEAEKRLEERAEGKRRFLSSKTGKPEKARTGVKV